MDLDNWFRCICPRGFTGVNCKIKINECASSPCAEGATCEDMIGTFKCLCPAGRYGRLCEGGFLSCFSSALSSATEETSHVRIGVGVAVGVGVGIVRCLVGEPAIDLFSSLH